MRKNRFNNDAETDEKVSVYELIVRYVSTVVLGKTRTRQDAEDYAHNVLIRVRDEIGDFETLLKSEVTDLKCESLTRYGFTMDLLLKAVHSEAVQPIWREQKRKQRRQVFSINEFDAESVESDSALKFDLVTFLSSLPKSDQLIVTGLEAGLNHDENISQLDISRANYFRRLRSLRDRLTKVLTNDR